MNPTPTQKQVDVLRVLEEREQIVSDLKKHAEGASTPDGVSSSMLGWRLGLSRRVARSRLRLLERREWVARRTPRNDGTVMFVMTEAGRSVLKKKPSLADYQESRARSASFPRVPHGGVGNSRDELIACRGTIKSMVPAGDMSPPSVGDVLSQHHVLQMLGFEDYVGVQVSGRKNGEPKLIKREGYKI